MESFDISMLDRSPARVSAANVEEDATLDDAPVLNGLEPREDDAVDKDAPADEEAAVGTPEPEPEEPSVVILRAWAFVLKSLETLPGSRPELIPRNLEPLKEWLREYSRFEVSFLTFVFLTRADLWLLD
jgi:hypothetical protein